MDIRNMPELAQRIKKMANDYILLAPHIMEESRGGIVLARMSRQMPDRGTVLHISDAARAELNNEVLPGTVVIFNKNHQQMDPDEKTTLIKAEHVLAIVT